MPKRIFVSYVAEDAQAANWIAEELRAVGLDVWLDRTRLRGGDDWSAELSRAITQADHFIAVFSPKWIERTRSVAFDEVELAYRERLNRPKQSRYFVPIKLDACELRAQPALAGFELDQIHCVPFFGRGLWDALRDLCAALSLESIRIDAAEPLAVGLPPSLRITNGAIITEKVEPTNQYLEGTERQIMSGELFRGFDESLRFHMKLRTPVQSVQRIEGFYGLDEVATASSDKYMSTSSETTKFDQSYNFTLPANFEVHPLFPVRPDRTRDLNVLIQVRFGLSVEPRSIVGLVDTVITVAPVGREVERRVQKSWGIMQAAIAR